MQYTEGRTSKEFAALSWNEADGQEHTPPMSQQVSASTHYGIRRTRRHCYTNVLSHAAIQEKSHC